MVLLRRIKHQDLPTICELIVEHSNHEGFPLDSFEKVSNLGNLLFGSNPKIFGWVAELDSEIVGYMTATIDFSTWNAASFVYLDCLYLKPYARGKKLGWKMMNELRQFAKERGCEFVEWQTPPTNEIGLNFYRKLDATELPKVRFTWQIGS